MDHEVLVRQDILPGWRPTRPLTIAQYMSVRGEHAMTSNVSHFTGLVDTDYDLPLIRLAEAFGTPP